MMFDLISKRYFNSDKPMLHLSKGQRDALSSFREKLKNGFYSFEECTCLCENDNRRVIAKRDRFGLDVGTYICRVCGLMWTSPQMTEDSLMKFYEEDYRPIYAGEAKASERFFIEQIERGRGIYDYVSDCCLDTKSGGALKVFDVGCGAGGTLFPFKEAGYQTFGCDLGSQYLEYGKKRGLLLEHGDVDSLVKYGPAHLILLNHVLEHFKFPLKKIQRLNNLLVDGGYLYIELPGILNIHNVYGDFLLFLQNAHLYHFTLDTLTSVMSKAGFKLIKGNQTIHAIFQKTGDVSEMTSNEDYQRILKYLTLMELFKKINLLHSYPKFCRLALKI